ncbi:CheR family methyltransferase [Micavibrio aeruginosavorus]|uniref:protein-glutamate O-methyltransferase n=1 Tax=Micavibrio aeruginosavorus EPB TaxID=349215 RepID=M4VKW6_9BACT|nr:protein-glutamate O-methyltransferase CheR [Micavibrio aeruginosavorus]AGH98751.1 Chemotaxis protein methyltransferase CheR [Micavibrio aeruginosavorus EPB]
MELSDFEFYKVLLKDKSGLSISPEKIYLLETRLAPVVQKWGHGTLDRMTQYLRMKRDEAIIKDVVEAMTTNETLFFRDDRPFKHFRTVILPEMIKSRANTRNLKIWSAACSSGQEPYSIAMTLEEAAFEKTAWRFDILATDIADSVLKQAQEGLYSHFEVQRGLPIQTIMKYFSQDGDRWRVKENLRKMIRFQKFNLLERMSSVGQFDIIFCRNVLIYFDEETKKKVLNGLMQQLAPDGYIFLGSSETVLGLSQNLKPVAACPGLYTVQKAEAVSREPVTATPKPTSLATSLSRV